MFKRLLKVYIETKVAFSFSELIGPFVMYLYLVGLMVPKEDLYSEVRSAMENTLTPQEVVYQWVFD